MNVDGVVCGRMEFGIPNLGIDSVVYLEVEVGIARLHLVDIFGVDMDGFQTQLLRGADEIDSGLVGPNAVLERNDDLHAATA